LDKLKAIREEMGLTQREAARASFVAQPTYCLIEQGKRRPSPETAKSIAKLFGIDWIEFFDD